jgi:hypothetical protein
MADRSHRHCYPIRVADPTCACGSARGSRVRISTHLPFLEVGPKDQTVLIQRLMVIPLSLGSGYVRDDRSPRKRPVKKRCCRRATKKTYQNVTNPLYSPDNTRSRLGRAWWFIGVRVAKSQLITVKQRLISLGKYLHRLSSI